MAALTPKYVTYTASGGNGDIGTPWTLTEAITNATAGMIVHIKYSATPYSIGTQTIAAGTVSNGLVFSGYHTNIGDCDHFGRAADGTLVTNNGAGLIMPDITLTGTLVTGNWCHLNSLNFSGSISGPLIGGTTNDNISITNCKVLNTANNAAARAYATDIFGIMINCDFECSGASHASVVEADNTSIFVGCRVKGVAATWLVTMESGFYCDSVFIGNGTISGMQQQVATTGQWIVKGCTFYNLATAIEVVNAVAQNTLVLVDCHATDCTTLLSNPYSGTAECRVTDITSRTRDITNMRTGFQVALLAGEVTTAGSAATDYTSVAADNFVLLAAAPGRNQGMMPNVDIGALQRVEPAGGGSVIHHVFQ